MQSQVVPVNSLKQLPTEMYLRNSAVKSLKSFHSKINDKGIAEV